MKQIKLKHFVEKRVELVTGKWNTCKTCLYSSPLEGSIFFILLTFTLYLRE